MEKHSCESTKTRIKEGRQSSTHELPPDVRSSCAPRMPPCLCAGSSAGKHGPETRQPGERQEDSSRDGREAHHPAASTVRCSPTRGMVSRQQEAERP